MIVIPAIDLIGGECVRLSEGDFDQKTVYESDPVKMAGLFADAGIERLHVVDLDGARAGQLMQMSIVESICARFPELTVDVGGGIRDHDDLRRAFDAGAEMVSLGSVAVKSRDLVDEWIRKFGGDAFIIAADSKDGCIAVSGWQEVSELQVSTFVGWYAESVTGGMMCTDVRLDGRMMGPAFGLYERLLAEFAGLPLVASGGVRSVDDLARLSEMGVPQAIVGKAFYEGHISAADLTGFAC